MIHRRAFIFVCSFALAAPFAVFGQVPSLSGKIVDDLAAPLVGASIVLRSTAAAATQLFKAAIAADGTYKVAAIPPGQYSVCLETPALSAHLNPCIWADTIPTVTVPASGVVPPLNPVIIKGAVLNVRLNDVKKQLLTPDAKGVVPALLLGVWTQKHTFYPLVETAKDALGATYRVAIPYDSDLALSMHGPSVNIAVDGKPMSAKYGASVPLRLDKLTPARSVTIDVVSLAP